MICTLEKIKQDFVNSLDDIVMFIDLIDMVKAQDVSFARTSKFYNRINESINEIKEKINDTKDIQYNAIIISLYGAFELSVKEATNAFIKFCINNRFSFADKLSKDYILSAAKAFERNTVGESKNIIKDLNSFLNEDDISKFSTELSLLNYQNLKSSIVQKIANSIEITNFLSDVKLLEDFQIYIKEREGLSSIEQASIYIEKISNPFQYIDDIVTSRNQIAHRGRADSRFDYRTIKDFIMREFKIVVDYYIKRLQMAWYQNCVQYNKFIKELNVVEIFNNNILCFNTEDLIVDKNSVVLIKNGRNKIQVATIYSIEFERKKIEQSEINQDVSCCVDKTCKKTFQYYIYVP